jgi:hypothetical protein
MTTKRKCKKCGKTFFAVLEWAYYCSGQCERLAHNPVAKFASRYNRSGVHKDKTKYSRKEKHRFLSDERNIR